MGEEEQYDPRELQDPLVTAIELVAHSRRMTKAEWTREAVIYVLTRDQGIPANVFKLLDGPKLRDAVKRVAKRRGMSAASYTTLACRQHIQRDVYARDWLTELDLGLADEPGSWSLH